MKQLLLGSLAFAVHHHRLMIQRQQAIWNVADKTPLSNYSIKQHEPSVAGSCCLCALA